MRRITKSPMPSVLEENFESWTHGYLANPENAAQKYRYREPSITEVLKEETHGKCVYCESKIGHNTPGDVEHKVPSSVVPTLHFSWDNLTIACTECNRRKLDYFSSVKPFLDPYVDNVEDRVVHHGPVVCWLPGDAAAETTIRILALNDMTRKELLARKIEAIDKLNNILARLKEADPMMKELLELRLEDMKSAAEEYSAMINSICRNYGI